MAMGTYPVNLTDGFAAIGDNAALSIYNIGSDRPTIRPTLRNQLAPVMDRHSILGGRQGELSDLFGWMERRRSGYTFVTGPSGYGKTALLVHFVRSLQARGEDPVYHFVSRRDDMLSQADFSFRSLCQQLIARHGYGGELPSSTAEVRGLYSALLRIPPPPGRRIVVVLDGLDEASDWSAGPQLFPAQLPSGVHVVFSAREVADRNWLDQLGLDGRVDFLRLEALDIAGVRDVLAAAGTESLTQAALSNAFVQAVHEVSGGDPFYLRFLVEDLAVSPDLPERAVRRKPKGLDAYLNLWWLDVAAKATAPAVADVLGYLAVATGRLTRAELADISDEDKLSGFTIDPAIEAVERYLIGTGGAGYTMSHPRFTDYVVNNRLRPEDLRHYREALLKWCLSWQGKGWPAGTPAYPLQHIVAHLIQDEEQAAHVYAVLDAPYMKAKLARFGSFRSLLDDLRSGVSAAMSAPRADVLFRLALMHNAIQDGVAALPLDELAPLYVRAGDLDRALDLAAAVRPLWLRGRTMIVIAGALLPNSWAEAVGVADRIELPGYRAEALFDVAAALLADDAKAPDADAILKRIDEIDLQDESAVWVAARLTKLAGASRRRDPARSEQFIERAVAAAHAADGQQRAMAFEAIGRSVAATDPDRACSFYRASLEALADMGLNEWQAKRARDTIKALADCDIAAAVGAAEAVSNDLIRPYVFAGLAEQADDPADACQWVERAMAAIPAIRRLYKTEAKRWAANARAAAAVGLAHHDLPGALALLREEPYYYRDAALKRMASVSAQKRDNVLVIADAASGPDVRDEVLATFIRREIVKDPHVIRDLIPLVTDPITTAALMVEATETPDDSQQDKKPILDLARPAALRVVHERPDLLARLAAVFDAYRRDSGRPLLALAAKSAQTAADGRISSGSPVLTVIRSCVDQGDTDSAMALLRQITRSLVAVDSETALQVRAMLVEAVARSDEAAAARLVQAGPDEDRAPLKAAIAKGVASSNPGRGAKLVSALPESEVPRDPAEDVRCQALGTLVESSAAAGPGGVKSRAAKLRKCHGESGWLDYKCDIHARASAAVARHDPELAEQLLRWVATKRYGDTALVAKALVALALVDNARGTSLAADVIEKYVQDGRGNQEDLAVLSSAVARFAPQDALAFLELRRLHQAGYRGQVLGWAAASMARTDAADAQQLLEHAVADVEQAESLWLRVDGLREVATATSTWDPARARALLERCIAWAREGTAVTTLAEQLARAANALIDVADMSAAAPWIEEALFLLRAEPAGAIRLDVLEAILAIQEKCPPGIAYPLLVHTVEAVLDGSPMMGEELLTLLRACLTVGQQDEPSAACELFSAFHAAVRSVEMIFAG